MAESGVECLNRVKTAQNSKNEGELKEKKHVDLKLAYFNLHFSKYCVYILSVT